MATKKNECEGIECPECGAPSVKVINSRPFPDYIYRMRECRNSHRFPTYEKTKDPENPNARLKAFDPCI